MFFFRRAKKDDKAEGEEFFGKGQWAQALKVYERVAEREPENVKILRRTADLRLKVGEKERARETYRKLADLYAESGFLMQAVAIQKILLRLDPSAEGVMDRLAELYAARGISVIRPSEQRRELPRIPLLSDLDPEAFRQVLDRLVPRNLDAGEMLFRQGDPGDSIFVVTSGVVRVSRVELVLGELGEGEFFGEGAFFSRQPRNADVTAVSASELLEIRRADLEALMARHAGVSHALEAFYRRRILDGLLAVSPLFSGLPEADRKRIADLFRMQPVRAGEEVLREGESDRSLYLIKGGSLDVTASIPGEEGELKLAELGPGEFFGEVALLGHTPRTATVTALEDGELLRIEGADLDPLLDAYPTLCQALERAREERARDAVEKVLRRTR